MSPKSLFTIFLKILGIFFIKYIFETSAQLILYLIAAMNGGVEVVAFMTFVTIVTIGCYATLSYVLIFKTEWLIDKLKLLKGIDEEKISMTIHRSTILSISIIVIGGLMVAGEVPTLAKHIHEYYTLASTPFQQVESIFPDLIVSCTKILIGLLMMGNVRWIVNLIERKRRTVQEVSE